MLVSLIDKFTSLDGGTHQLVDFKVVLKHASDKSSSTTPLKELVFARLFAMYQVRRSRSLGSCMINFCFQRSLTNNIIFDDHR